MRNWISGLRVWDWVHPSHRDLVIDQLSSSEEMSEHYIKHGGVAAISLALSQAGGAAGERSFPLLKQPQSWKVLEAACIARIRESPIQHAAAVFTALENATSGRTNDRLRKLILSVCSAASEHWNAEGTVLSAGLINRFFKLCEKSRAYVRGPSLQPSWLAACGGLKKEAKDAKEFPDALSTNALGRWIDLLYLIMKTEPRLIDREAIEEDFGEMVEEYLTAIRELVDAEFSEDDPEEYQREAERSVEISRSLAPLGSLFPSKSDVIESLTAQLETRSESLEEEGEELKAELGLREPDDDDYRPSPSREDFDVESLFEDL